MKRITSALLLATLLVSGGAAAANAAPAKADTGLSVVSPDRVGAWPY